MPADPQQVQWFIRFWEKVDQRGPDECWLWTAGCFTDGYGSFRLGGRSLRAHRVSYEVSTGPIPEGLVVMHSCDTPLCVNPAHLSVGTVGDNSRDMVSKKRHRNSRKDACVRGHEFTSATTYIRPNGSRECRVCHANTERDRRASTSR